MTALVLFHDDLVTELKAVTQLTSDVTDPNAVQALDAFCEQLNAVVDDADVHQDASVSTFKLPWVSRPLTSELTLNGPNGAPVTAREKQRLRVDCRMHARAQPRALRAHKASYLLSDVQTVVSVVDDAGKSFGEVNVPLLGGHSFVQASGLPMPATLGMVVEALALAAFPEEVGQLREAKQSFSDWDTLCSSRAVRWGTWQAVQASKSTWPSKTIHRLDVPVDLFVRVAPRPTSPAARREAVRMC